jgi:hypothetical protein
MALPPRIAGAAVNAAAGDPAAVRVLQVIGTNNSRSAVKNKRRVADALHGSGILSSQEVFEAHDAETTHTLQALLQKETEGHVTVKDFLRVNLHLRDVVRINNLAENEDAGDGGEAFANAADEDAANGDGGEGAANGDVANAQAGQNLILREVQRLAATLAHTNRRFDATDQAIRDSREETNRRFDATDLANNAIGRRLVVMEARMHNAAVILTNEPLAPLLDRAGRVPVGFPRTLHELDTMSGNASAALLELYGEAIPQSVKGKRVALRRFIGCAS